MLSASGSVTSSTCIWPNDRNRQRESRITPMPSPSTRVLTESQTTAHGTLTPTDARIGRHCAARGHRTRQLAHRDGNSGTVHQPQRRRLGNRLCTDGLRNAWRNATPHNAAIDGAPMLRARKGLVLRALDSNGTPTPSGTFSARVRGRSSGLRPQQVG